MAAVLSAARACASRMRYSRSIPSNSGRSEEHTSELQSHLNLVCRLLLEKKKQTTSLYGHVHLPEALLVKKDNLRASYTPPSLEYEDDTAHIKASMKDPSSVWIRKLTQLH